MARGKGRVKTSRRAAGLLAVQLAVGAVAAVAAWSGPACAEPLAWRITEGSGALALLGSVHYLRKQDYPLPPVVDRLYEEAGALLFELDLDDLDGSTIQAELMAAALLPEGTSLEARLGPELYALTERRAREFGLGLHVLDRFEPWLAAITLLDLGMAAEGFDPNRGVEQYLLGRATRDGKQVLGLESLGTQVAVFDGLSSADQAALLEQTLSELDDPAAAIAPLVTAWREGRLENLSAALLDDFAEFPSLYDRLVVARNRAWVPELERHLAKGEHLLVVVGALHLVGPNSVIELLQQRGHRVQPIE
jgi:uncharacterized protein YbaP (TraB family)